MAMPTPSPTPSAPELRFFAGLWTLRGYPHPDREWTIPQKFAAVKAAGFEGIGGRFVAEAPELCAELGLDYVLYIDADASDYAAQFQDALRWKPRRINVQLCEHDTSPARAAEAWIQMAKRADELGLAIDLELHRDTATETPEKAYEIADRVLQSTGQAVRLCLDYSHFAVTKHLAPPFAPRLLERADLVGPVRQLHLRPFNGHHAQVPVTDGHGGLSPEAGPYLEFVDALFALMRQTAQPGDVIYACPENGPKTPGGYGLSCFPDVWTDTIRLRDEARSRWNRICARST